MVPNAWERVRGWLRNKWVNRALLATALVTIFAQFFRAKGSSVMMKTNMLMSSRGGSPCQGIMFGLMSSKDEFWKVRKLVGSIHATCGGEDSRITVFAENEPNLEELSIWRGVHVISDPCLALTGMSEKTGCNVTDEAILAYLVARSDVGVRVSLGVVFDNQSLSYILQELKKHPHRQGLSFSAQFGRSVHPSRDSSVRLQVAKKEDQFCELAVAPLPYPITYPADHILEVNPQTQKSTRVALLIPTKPNGPIADSSLARILLPSLLRSLSPSDLDASSITVFLGYDREDEWFDGPKRNETIKFLRSAVEGTRLTLRLVRLPRVRWLTFLWNLLFQLAYQDNFHYFFQMGDDIRFLFPGWLPDFISKMKERKDVGVVAPNDVRWGCQLFTQAFVGRPHFTRFASFFPLELRDWYSDNWITEVYDKPLRHCFTQHTVSNDGGAPRYTPCRTRDRYLELVRRDFVIPE